MRSRIVDYGLTCIAILKIIKRLLKNNKEYLFSIPENITEKKSTI